MKKGGREKSIGCQKFDQVFLYLRKTWMTSLTNPAEWMLRVNQWVQMEFCRVDQLFTTTTVKMDQARIVMELNSRRNVRGRIYAWVQSVPLANLASHPTLAEQPRWAHTRPSDHVGPLLAEAHSLSQPFVLPVASCESRGTFTRPLPDPCIPPPVTPLLSKHLSPSSRPKSASNLPCETVLTLCVQQNLPVLPFTSWRLWLPAWNTSLYQFVYSAAFLPTTIISTTAHGGNMHFQTKQLLLHTISLDVRQLQECLIDLAAHWHCQIQASLSPICHLWCQLVLKLTLPYSCMAIANPGKPPDPKTPSGKNLSLDVFLSL